MNVHVFLLIDNDTHGARKEWVIPTDLKLF